MKVSLGHHCGQPFLRLKTPAMNYYTAAANKDAEQGANVSKPVSRALPCVHVVETAMMTETSFRCVLSPQLADSDKQNNCWYIM